jgi:putative ABC transport system permease protein
LFPIFFVAPKTVMMQAGAAMLMGFIAAAVPGWRAATMNIVKGLRSIA